MYYTIKRPLLLALIATTGFITFLLGYLMHANWFTAYDQWGHAHFFAGNNTAYQHLAETISIFGDFRYLLVATILLAGWLVWQKRQRLGLWFVWTFIGFGCAGAWIAKQAIHRPRPEYKLIAESGFSFPSAHATLTTVFYVALLLVAYQTFPDRTIKRVWTVATIAIILAIMWARVSLGVHYPTDVTAGVCYGSALVAWSAYWTQKK